MANGAERSEIYSLGGRLNRSIEPDGTMLSIGYAPDGTIADVEHSNGERATYTRGCDGRSLIARLGRTETEIVFDARGLPECLHQRVNQFTWTIRYRHDEHGRITAILYPGRTQWTEFKGGHPGERRASFKIVEAGLTLVETEFDAARRATHTTFATGAATVETFADGDEPRLASISHQSASGGCFSQTRYTFDANGRIAEAGHERFFYDDAGRLIRHVVGSGESLYAFDSGGRLTRAGDEHFAYGEGAMVRRAGINRFDYDACGRRLCKRGVEGETHYAYNLYGQLAWVRLPAEGIIGYVYDGFGRLVAREAAGRVDYFIVGYDGVRLAEADADATIRCRYLWMGKSCIAALDRSGITTFHRIHAGRLVATGDAHGVLTVQVQGSAYGAGAAIAHGLPGFGSLFGDPATGLLHAGSRWYDPDTAQFLTADSWFGTDAWNHVPGRLRQTLDALPGGTNIATDRMSAYVWCDHDPVNRSDPNGHNWLGWVWSVLSFFFWQMQVTSVALQMEVINIFVNIVLAPFYLVGRLFGGTWDFYEKISIFGGIPPYLGSSRLMVPFALPLNGIWNASGAVFTMGAVIWMNRSQMNALEESSQRDILNCANAQDYVAASGASATDTIRALNESTVSAAAVDAGGTNLTGFTPGTGAGGVTVANMLNAADWLAIRLLAGGEDELRQATGTPGATVAIDTSVLPALPAAFFGQAVSVRRVDQPIVRIRGNGRTIARSLTFVRDTTLHYQTQIPGVIPTTGLDVAEFLPAVRRDRSTGIGSAVEFFVVRFSNATDQALYAASDFVRIRSGTTYFGRQLARLLATTDVVLDVPLPTPTPPANYSSIEIVKLNPDVTANNQSANADRVDAGNTTTLKKFDGLEIAAGGVTDRRIVIATFLRCPIAAPPVALQGIVLTVETLIPGEVFGGNVTTAAAVTATPGQANLGKLNNRPARVEAGGNSHLAVATVAGDVITLVPPLPAVFTVGLAVNVTLLARDKSFDAEATVAPHDSVTLVTDDLTVPAVPDILFLLPRGSNVGGALAIIAAPTIAVAQVDSAPTNTANLTVRRFVPDPATLRAGVSAPSIVLRLDFGAAPPFAANDELHVAAGEEAYAKVLSLAGNFAVLEEPIELPGFTTPATVQRITPTGKTTAGATLQESLILIPSDMDEEPVTRRRAVELHEMRHAWQYAVLGPFFFSLPIPWLFNLGFSISGEGAGHATHSLTKWFSVGLLDKGFAALAWGLTGGGFLGGFRGKRGKITDTLTAEGVIAAGSKTITLAEETLAAVFAELTEGSPIEVKPSEGNVGPVFNIVQGLDQPERLLRLRFKLEGAAFAAGARATVSVSPFNKIEQKINKWFSLNLERFWSDHIPSAWGRALSGILNRENWFPFLGLYCLSFYKAGLDQTKVSFEQDASFQSGEVYTPFTISKPNEVFVGQFSRVYAFVYGRDLDTRFGLSASGTVVEALTVQPPAVPAGSTLQDMVAGSMPSATNPATQVRFRQNWLIPIRARVENVIGALFAATVPGDYRLHTPSELAGSPERMLFFSADFHELRTIAVKPLVVTPVVNPIFETEAVTFVIAGDPAATYALRYKGTPPAQPGVLAGQSFVAPELLTATPVTHSLEITATYAADAAIFSGPEQAGAVRLTPAERTNVCQDLSFDVAPIVVAAIPAVAAGASIQFDTPIAAAAATITSPMPAGATIPASVQLGTGRPATLTFFAPDAVAAAIDVTFDLRFGTAPGPVKTVNMTVQVNP
jgi:RHS repeat-associated protein